MGHVRLGLNLKNLDQGSDSRIQPYESFKMNLIVESKWIDLHVNLVALSFGNIVDTNNF